MTEDKPMIDERLALAEQSSNLKPQRDSSMPLNTLDLLTAAGWSSRTRDYLIGRMLIALESAWDSSEHPRPPRADQIEAMAAAMPPMVDVELTAANGTKVLKQVSRTVAAKFEAERWYEKERIRVIGRLSAWQSANSALSSWIQTKGMGNPDGKARSMLVWWLDRHCAACSGTKLEPLRINGRGAVGAVRVCKPCSGLGERELPHGQDGRVIERHLIDCKHRAMQKIRQFTAQHHVT